MTLRMKLEALAARLGLSFLSPLMLRLHQRAQWWPLGLFPLRSHVEVRHFNLHGRLHSLSFPNGELERQQWEVRHLLTDDPYQLRSIHQPIRTVMDIGGNIGFFAILARMHFPQAVIHCYEPNPALLPITRANTEGLDIQVFGEGVGCREMTGVMRCEGDTLDGTLVPSTDEGAIPIVSLAQALQRLGGQVDLLKMDCEGAEWDILQDESSLSQVRLLTMEYHLFGGQDRTLLKLLERLKRTGFFLDALREAAHPQVGQLFASRRA